MYVLIALSALDLITSGSSISPYSVPSLPTPSQLKQKQQKTKKKTREKNQQPKRMEKVKPRKYVYSNCTCTKARSAPELMTSGVLSHPTPYPLSLPN
ncbi:hypothetical protein ABFX02_03G074700 [Erythranthe guttata]